MLSARLPIIRGRPEQPCVGLNYWLPPSLILCLELIGGNGVPTGLRLLPTGSALSSTQVSDGPSRFDALNASYNI